MNYVLDLRISSYTEKISSKNKKVSMGISRLNSSCIFMRISTTSRLSSSKSPILDSRRASAAFFLLEISAKILQSFFSSSVMNGYQNMLVQVKNVIVISVFYFMDREFA